MTERNEHHAFKTNEIPCQEVSDPVVLSKTPLVSVNMITYNHEPYIAQAIESVLMQETDFPIELIIGEDCSTDRTREIVLDYQKKYPDIIRIITSDKNVGMKKNSYRTRKACRGKYIAYCEGDDYWIDPSKLQKQVDFLDGNPEYGMVHTDFAEKNESTDVFINCYNKTNNINIPEGKIFEDLLGTVWLIHTQTVLIRTDIIKSYESFLKENEKEAKKWRYGDIPTFLYVANYSKIKYFNFSTAVYRILEESACHTKSLRKKLYNPSYLHETKFFFMVTFGTRSNSINRDVKIELNKAGLRHTFEEKNYQQAQQSYAFLKAIKRLNIKDRIYFLACIPIINPIAKPLIKLMRKLRIILILMKTGQENKDGYY